MKLITIFKKILNLWFMYKQEQNGVYTGNKNKLIQPDVVLLTTSFWQRVIVIKKLRHHFLLLRSKVQVETKNKKNILNGICSLPFSRKSSNLWFMYKQEQNSPKKKKKTYPIQPYYLIGQSDHSSEVKRHYYFLSWDWNKKNKKTKNQKQNPTYFEWDLLHLGAFSWSFVPQLSWALEWSYSCCSSPSN